MPKAIAIVSGGLDSITLAYLLHTEGYELHLLSFDYGQRHRKELAYAERCARRLSAAFDIVDLSSIGRFLKGSALTDTIPVPDGHYAAPSMAITVVPNRNAMMLSVAYAVAVAEQAQVVAIVHLGKHQIVQLGTTLQVPYADTWSCYKGEERHCGTCGTCFERKEAFELAGIPDPTEYEGEGT